VIENEILFSPREDPKPAGLSLLTGLLPPWRNHLTDWTIEGKKWLEQHIPREAPAFARPPQFEITDNSIQNALAELRDYRERLIDIQKRI